MEFLQHGMKWIVENQGSSNGVVTVEVADKKHQVGRFLTSALLLYSLE